MPFRKSILLHELARQGALAERIAALARLVGPLERMENFLSGREPPDHYVRGFSDEWWRLQFGRPGSDIRVIVDGLEEYCEQIHFFSPDPENRARAPMLFDEDRLRPLTRETYDRMRALWVGAAQAE
jgi:hypothetical protein